jgi:3-hydroxyacyl-CoA dehydrogenase
VDVKRTGVVGAGVMGSGIAQMLAQAGCDVVCIDIDPAQLERAVQLVETGRYGLTRAIERGKLSETDAASARRRLHFSSELGDVASSDIVVEAVPEDLGLKMALFSQLDALVADHTVLASNSSGLPVIAMARATGRADRVIGWHWASPPTVMRMAEIVMTAETSQATVDIVVALARRCGKNPVVVKDDPLHWGYVGNRIWMAAIREARAVVAEGIAGKAEVDQILQDGWRWPVGPFGMISGATEGWGDNHRSSVGRMTTADTSVHDVS